ncbi:PAP2 superfamily protein [Actinacidiphila cocklensis]|uniref:PAP2 superfamily protein n=1 Tax=Actinacidiphila cocklensis TaxID=887465 RepID=A0A9W4GNR9_9ACTN|nr:PAP2 superfamily protein [Actinacidiphila cocklensis]
MKNVWGPDGGRVIGRLPAGAVTYGFTGTPRSRSTPQGPATSDNVPMIPHHRHGSALAHETAGSDGGPGTPRRSVRRSSHTPRDGRYGDRHGRPGTIPPVPGRRSAAWALGALTAVFFAGVALFVLLTWQVSAGGPLVDRDWSVLGWFQRASAAHPALNGPAQTLSDVGNVQVAVPLLLAAVVYAALRGRAARRPLWWLPPLAAAAAMAAVPLVVGGVKSAVGRPAPGKVHLGPNGYAGFFPSGHTATSAVAIGAAALLVLPLVPGPAVRRSLAAMAVLLAAAVGAALVWHGYHWPLDVLASWCLAAALLAAVAAAGVAAAAAGPRHPAAGGSAVGGEAEVDTAAGGLPT